MGGQVPVFRMNWRFYLNQPRNQAKQLFDDQSCITMKYRHVGVLSLLISVIIKCEIEIKPGIQRFLRRDKKTGLIERAARDQAATEAFKMYVLE